ncbi:phage head closure protein [Rhizobium straminoryzae]|uniref:Head-tail adaptor protein n=1 Tax=Rhizobium straminoryzae TaxID=1387186 RepID=A0A549SM15_9HYPH|nr:phage head closure protein [Rhizobium straminoryzae]TRL30669.1 head-tail adaptor protein [Rhizobium straminoryzae]
MRAALLDPGRRTARLVREVPVETADGQGGASLGWTAAGLLWAQIEPVSHAASELAGGRRVVLTHRIWIPWQTGVAAGQRLRKGTRIFAIQAVRDPDESGRFLVCDCEEEAS